MRDLGRRAPLLAQPGAPRHRDSAPAAPRRFQDYTGPQQPLYLNGSRLLSTLGMGPIGEGMGLIHVVLSYDGRISIGLTRCREMMPDLDVYAAHLRAAHDELAGPLGL